MTCKFGKRRGFRYFLIRETKNNNKNTPCLAIFFFFFFSPFKDGIKSYTQMKWCIKINNDSMKQNEGRLKREK